MTKADRLARKQAQKQVKETRAAAFPADLVNVLLQYLDSFQDVVSVGLVSRRFYQIALKDVKKPNYSQAKLLDRWTTEKIEIKPSHYSSSQILICPQLGKLLHGRQIEYKVDLENFKIAQKDPTQAKRIAEEKGHISAITTFRFGYAPKKCFYTSSGLLMEEKSFNEKMQEHGPRISYHIGTHPGHINPLKDEQPPLIKRREEMYVDGEIQGWVYTYFANGKLETEQEYSKNWKKGAGRTYSTDGTLEYSSYISKGDLTEFHPNGKMKSMLHFDSEHVFSTIIGPTILAFYSSGTPRARIHVKKGARDQPELDLGGAEFWHDNAASPYARWSLNKDVTKKGKKTFSHSYGLLEEWHPNGVLLGSYPFEKGLWHGKFRRWHNNGKQSLEVSVNCGKIEGQINNWDEQGERLGTAGVENIINTQPTRRMAAFIATLHADANPTLKLLKAVTLPESLTL